MLSHNYYTVHKLVDWKAPGFGYTDMLYTDR